MSHHRCCNCDRPCLRFEDAFDCISGFGPAWTVTGDWDFVDGTCGDLYPVSTGPITPSNTGLVFGGGAGVYFRPRGKVRALSAGAKAMTSKGASVNCQVVVWVKPQTAGDQVRVYCGGYHIDLTIPVAVEWAIVRLSVTPYDGAYHLLNCDVVEVAGGLTYKCISRLVSPAAGNDAGFEALTVGAAGILFDSFAVYNQADSAGTVCFELCPLCTACYKGARPPGWLVEIVTPDWPQFTGNYAVRHEPADHEECGLQFPVNQYDWIKIGVLRVDETRYSYSVSGHQPYPIGQVWSFAKVFDSPPKCLLASGVELTGSPGTCRLTAIE
jgi:hypothetical protein